MIGSAMPQPGARTLRAPSSPHHRRGLIKQLELTPAFVGFLLYVFVIITSRLPIGELGVLLGLGGLLLQGVKLRFPRYLQWSLALFVWSALTMAWSSHPELVADTLVPALKLWIITVLGVNAIRSPRQLVVFFAFFLFWFLVYPVRGALLNYLHGIVWFGRVGWQGNLSNSNYLACACLVAITFAVSLIPRTRSRSVRAALFLSTLPILGVIIVTESRQAIIGVAFFAMLAILASRKPTKALLAVMALAGVVLVAAPEAAFKRLAGLANLGREVEWNKVDEGSAAQRVSIYKTALTILGDHPVGGTGAGTYPVMNEEYNPTLGKWDTHNTYLHVAVERGLIGLFLFLGMIGSVFRVAWRRSRALATVAPRVATAMRLCSAGLACFMVASIWGSYDTFQFLHFLVLGTYLTATLLTPADSFIVPGEPQAVPASVLHSGVPPQIII